MTATAAAILAGLAGAFLQPQRDDPIVARFLVGGRSTSLLHGELAIEVARRLRRSSEGRDAIRLLVDRELVTTRAATEGVAATRAEIEARIAQIVDALKAQGQDLADFLAQKQLGRAEFERDYVALSIAHERLVRRAMELGDADPVTPDMLELWLTEARAGARVVDDQDALPPGVVARVGTREIGFRELGAVLLQNLGADERARHVRRVVLRRLLAHEASAAGLTVTEEDTRREIAVRKAAIESDPQYRGVSYADWLMQTQGIGPDELARDPQMVATVQQQMLVDRRHDADDLARRIRDDRDAVLRRHGERRDLSILLLRAIEQPNELIPRTFDAARTELLAIRDKITAGLPFDRAARVHSEDPYSKPKSGVIGSFVRGATDLPEAVLDAAFSLEPAIVSEPIRVAQGMLLLRVDRVEPAPDDAELMHRLRGQLANDFLVELLERSQLEILTP